MIARFKRLPYAIFTNLDYRVALPMNDQRNKQVKNRIIWLTISVAIIVFDQISKWAVMEKVMRPKATGESGYGFFEWYQTTPSIVPFSYIEISSFFNLVMAWNTGVSFSMFSNQGEYMPYILIAVALCITIAFTAWLWNTTSHIQGVSYALIIGGALGNILDRSRFGAVIDFLDFHIFGYHWPAFNIADISVVTGICLLIIVSLFFDVDRKDL